MPPEGYVPFWDRLMAEQGVDVWGAGVIVEDLEGPDYSVGDVIVGEVVYE